MASFNRYSNFNKKANMRNLHFAGGVKVWEVHLNDMQEIIATRFEDLHKRLLTNGIYDLSIATGSIKDNKLTLKNIDIHINGANFNLDGTYTLNVALPVDKKILVTANSQVSTVSQDDSIYVGGNLSLGAMLEKNPLKDALVTEEVVRAKQYTISLLTDTYFQGIETQLLEGQLILGYIEPDNKFTFEPNSEVKMKIKPMSTLGTFEIDGGEIV